MSVPVPLAELAETLQHYPMAFLLTVGEGERVHAVQASPSVAGDRLRLPHLGRRTLANASERTSVTVLWPPTEPDGYSLIVDGDAELSDDGVLVSPTRAVLHRVASTVEPTGDGCASDCLELPLNAS
jgi:hypothetical protein